MDGMVNTIAEIMLIWGHCELVGRAVGASSTHSWEAKIALVRRSGPLRGRGRGPSGIVFFLLGLFESISRNPPSDGEVRQ